MLLFSYRPKFACKTVEIACKSAGRKKSNKIFKFKIKAHEQVPKNDKRRNISKTKKNILNISKHFVRCSIYCKKNAHL